jgi:hypothetical protein
MIIGLLLAITTAISITSLLIIITGTTGILRENLATGAVIGASGAVSYALITLIIALIATFFLIKVMRKP